MKVAIVGGAGFIGSHLADRLVARGDDVVVVDDLSVGRVGFIAGAIASGRAVFERMEVSGEPACVAALTTLFRGCDSVFHLAANPDARFGLRDTSLDLRQNTVTTWAALEAARLAGVGTFALASSGTVYGEALGVVDEDHGPNVPISLYGASKVAAEALVSAFSHCFGVRGLVFRFGNVVGPRATHGVIADFVDKLVRDASELEVLGDGAQRKPYLHVDDCTSGMLFALDHASRSHSTFNLAPDDTTSVADIASMVVDALGLRDRARIRFTGGERGWPGDVPRTRLSPERLARLGFRVSMGSDAAVRRAVAEIVRERAGTRP